jgi:hypothetical protein
MDKMKQNLWKNIEPGGENDETLEIRIFTIACSFSARGNRVRRWRDA